MSKHVFFAFAVSIAILGGSYCFIRSGGTPVKIQVTELSWVTKSEGETYQEVLVTWKNVGTRPIRLVKAMFVNSEESLMIQSPLAFTIYLAPDSEPGIAPGETYSTPRGEGFRLPGNRETPGFREVKSVDVAVVVAKEFSGQATSEEASSRSIKWDGENQR